MSDEYKFVTREEVVDRGLAWHDLDSKGALLLHRLLAERDAFRKVANRLAADYTTAEFDVDAEARRILGDSSRLEDK